MVANLYPVFGNAPKNLVTLLTLAGGALAATKVTPTVAAGEVGIIITGIFVTSQTDNSLTFTLHAKQNDGVGTDFLAVHNTGSIDATSIPAQMLNSTSMPGLLLLNSTSPVFFLGEGEELGIQVAGGAGAELVNVLVCYQKLSV